MYDKLDYTFINLLIIFSTKKNENKKINIKIKIILENYTPLLWPCLFIDKPDNSSAVSDLYGWCQTIKFNRTW